MVTRVSESAGEATIAEDAVPVLHCAYHPDRETLLRCNRCGNPICTESAVLTEVGYRCKQCVRNQRQVYYNNKPYDLPVAAIIGFVLGGLVITLGALFAFRLLTGWFAFIIAFFIGPAVGGIIAEAIRWSTGRRRFERRNVVSAGATAAGMILAGLFWGLGAWFFGPALFAALPILLFATLAVSTIYARLP